MMIGRILKGQYEICEELGTGGLATVYLARDTRTGQSVAVKLLHPHVATDGESRTRFEREASLMRALETPHFVHVFDHGQEGERPFLVMEYVDGSTVKALIADNGKVPVRRALAVGRQVAEGLSAIHRRGVIHRDIKPLNIMVRPDGSIKVMDFGIAKAANMSTLTKTGYMVGTPHYIAPEQAVGNPVDERSDIYSLGVVLYEMLTGTLLFSGKTPIAILLKHVKEPVPPDWAQRYGLTSEVADVVNCCLEKNPTERYQTAEELIAAIDRCLRSLGQTTSHTRTSPPLHPSGSAAVTPPPRSGGGPGRPATVAGKERDDATVVLQPAQASGPELESGRSVAVIREMITRTLDDEELKSLCRDHYPSVYEGFTEELRKSQRIRLLLSHCQERNELRRLVKLAREYRT